MYYFHWNIQQSKAKIGFTQVGIDSDKLVSEQELHLLTNEIRFNCLHKSSSLILSKPASKFWQRTPAAVLHPHTLTHEGHHILYIQHLFCHKAANLRWFEMLLLRHSFAKNSVRNVSPAPTLFQELHQNPATTRVL